MDNLSEQQYQSVLKYMQDTNQDNFQEAYKIMRDCNYNIATARQKKLNQNQNNRMENNGQLGHREQYRQILEEEEDEQISKIRKYLLHRVSTRKRRNRLMKFTQCIKNMCIRATETFIPDMINRKIIKSYFYRTYQDSAVIQLKNRSLRMAIDQSRINRKKLMVIVSERAKNHCIQEFLKKKAILLKIMEEYQIVGLTDIEFKAQFKQIYCNPTSNSNHSLDFHPSYTQTNLPQANPPCILVFREKHTQDLQLIHAFNKQSQILGINDEILDLLKDRIKSNSQKQSALLRRISQHLFQQNLAIMQNRRIAQAGHQHDDQVDNVQANFIKNRRESKLIEQQNKQYLEMQRKKKEKQEKQRQKQQKIQQFLQQRNCRKLSMPDQPSDEQDGIIKIIFRCPNGQNISRKFLLNQKCQLLFNWVELNDQIQFQNQQENVNIIKSQSTATADNIKIIHKNRDFDLLFSYPPESLRDKKQLLLSDIFEGENQVKILIRQE